MSNEQNKYKTADKCAPLCICELSLFIMDGEFMTSTWIFFLLYHFSM